MQIFRSETKQRYKRAFEMVGWGRRAWKEFKEGVGNRNTLFSPKNKLIKIKRITRKELTALRSQDYSLRTGKNLLGGLCAAPFTLFSECRNSCKGLQGLIPNLGLLFPSRG